MSFDDKLIFRAPASTFQGVSRWNDDPDGRAGHLTAFGEERGFAPAYAAAFAWLSRLSIGPLTNRFGHFRTLLSVSLVHPTGVVLLAAAGSQASILAAVLLIGIGFGGPCSHLRRPCAGVVSLPPRPGGE